MDSHITYYQVSLAWFIFRVDVLNLSGPATEWGKPIEKGGFGEVMTGFSYGHKVYVVKRKILKKR